MGDYAESIARQLARASSSLPAAPEAIRERIVEMANLAIPMLHDAIEAFVRQDAELAKKRHRDRAGGRRSAAGQLNADVIGRCRSRRSCPRC